MDAQAKLKHQYANKPIYTSGFFADPESDLDNRQKLQTALKSFVKNQQPDTPFALQIMATNSEITIAPLGLLELDELETYLAEQRRAGLPETAALPLMIQFEPHIQAGELQKDRVASVQALFADFNATFELIWQQVKADIALNETLLLDLTQTLIKNGQTEQQKMLTHLQTLSTEERQKTLGFAIEPDKLDTLTRHLTDQHQSQAIMSSAAALAMNEIIGNDLFGQALNDPVRRNIFFWNLDNTFYEIFYYYTVKYGTKQVKLTKYLQHQRSQLLETTRQLAWEKAQAITNDPVATKQLDLNRYFADVFTPLAEKLTVLIHKFTNSEIK